MDNSASAATEAIKAVPAATAGTLILFGYPLTEWVVLGSALLIFLQLVFLLLDKLYKPWKDKHVKQRD